MNQKPVIGIGIAAIVAVLCEVFDIQDLAKGAEIQRRWLNRMTPPGFSWVQPMFPSIVPFDTENFDEKFLDELLGEDKNSVAIYPLSLALDPHTRETLVYNADGLLIAVVPADPVVREWPEDADPSRVTLLLDLLPAEDVACTRKAASRNTTRLKPQGQRKPAKWRRAVSGQASSALPGFSA